MREWVEKEGSLKGKGFEREGSLRGKEFEREGV